MSIVTVMALDVELHFSTIAKETLHFGALVAWFSTIVIHITSQSREHPKHRNVGLVLRGDDDRGNFEGRIFFMRFSKKNKKKHALLYNCIKNNSPPIS